MQRLWVSLMTALCMFSGAIGSTAFAQKASPPAETPRSIALEVLIVATAGDAKEVRTIEFSGPADKVAAHVRELEQKSALDVVDRIRITTLEHQKAMVQVGRTVSVLVGRSFPARGGFGQAANQYQRESIGTIVQAFARVDGAAVIVELNVEKSDFRAPKRVAEKEEDEADVVPPAMETLTCQGTLRIEADQTVLVGGMQSNSQSETSQHLVLASAKILDLPEEKDARVEPQDDRNENVIFPLKSLSADDAARVLREVFSDQAEAVSITADVRSNSLIIRSSDKLLQQIKELLTQLEKANALP